MEFSELQRNWEAFGKSDPLWAILADDRYKGGAWDLEEFFGRGEPDVEAVREIAAEHGLSFGGGEALDFGCGVGRLTQALCKYAAHTTGVDIAPSMVEQAVHFNRHGQSCRYVVNSTNDLSQFDSDRFDLVLSLLVLQHMHPEYAASYIREFVRVLRPGGTLIFQLPARYLGQVESVPPLTDAARTCRLEPVRPPARFEPGGERAVTVRVTNTSGVKWSVTDHPLRVGNHWLDEAGEMLVQDDGRVGLPTDLQAGATGEVKLWVTAPREEGRYLLEIDMVEETVAWFGTRAATSVKIPVTVKRSKLRHLAETSGIGRQPARSVSVDSDEHSAPIMEMYGTPRDDVVAILGAAGANVRAVVADEAALDWESYTYFATK